MIRFYVRYFSFLKQYISTGCVKDRNQHSANIQRMKKTLLFLLLFFLWIIFYYSKVAKDVQQLMLLLIILETRNLCSFNSVSLSYHMYVSVIFGARFLYFCDKTTFQWRKSIDEERLCFSSGIFCWSLFISTRNIESVYLCLLFRKQRER